MTFEIILSKLAAIVAIPLSKDFSETSITVKPLWAKVSYSITHRSCLITAIIFIYCVLKFSH
jgi:hypothetical protein